MPVTRRHISHVVPNAVRPSRFVTLSDERGDGQIRTNGEENLTGILEMRSERNTGTAERDVGDRLRRECTAARIILRSDLKKWDVGAGTGSSWHRVFLVSLCLSVYKRMLGWFPTLPVATACFLYNPPDLNFLDPYFIFMYMHYNHCHRATAHLQFYIYIYI